MHNIFFTRCARFFFCPLLASISFWPVCGYDVQMSLIIRPIEFDITVFLLIHFAVINERVYALSIPFSRFSHMGLMVLVFYFWSTLSPSLSLCAMNCLCFRLIFKWRTGLGCTSFDHRHEHVQHFPLSLLIPSNVYGFGDWFIPPFYFHWIAY